MSSIIERESVNIFVNPILFLPFYAFLIDEHRDSDALYC